MIKRCVGFLVLAVVLAASGCGGGTPDDQPPTPDAPPPPEPARLGDHIDLSLADLLARPRAELAVLADDLLTKARVRERAHRQTREVYLLLPDLHLPLAVPVLREAKFSTQAGFSLPPYLPAGTADPALALHLARHADVEAARRLVDPGDAETRQRIDACTCERNYPVEWVRLVALLQHTAESRVATGDIDGATELVQLHRQLKEVLDARAARGPLGALLLPRGRQVLAMARAAWASQGQPLLAQDIKEALASWGDPPGNTVTVPLGTPRDEVSRLLRSPAQGRVVPALSTARGLDLFGLPVPDDGVDGVFAFCDRADRLSQVLVVYHERTGEYYPRPGDLAFVLREQLPDNGEGATTEDAGVHGLQRQVYALGDLACDVTVVSRNNAVGGLVRCLAAAGTPGPQGLTRDLGAVHLDRSFEQDRLRLAPEVRAEEVRTERAEALAGIKSPQPGLSLAEVVLRRTAEQDLVGRVTLRYRVEQMPPLPQIVLPLWSAWGTSRFEGVDDDHGGHLAFRWEDAATAYTLRLPHQTTDRIELEVADRHASRDLPARAGEAVAFDRAERQARFASGKLLTRLPRSIGLDTVRLGMGRAEVEQLLPGGKAVLAGRLPDGFVLTFPGEPVRGATFVVRQLFLRFDAADRLAEMRARYQDTSPGNGPARGLPQLLAGLKKAGGAPEVVRPPWAAVWPDLPPRKPVPVCYRWRDDATLLNYQADGHGAEVTVRDCPADREGGAALAPFEYLPRGPEGCKVGDTRDALLRRWNVAQPATAGGALVLTPVQPAPYDALLVWFDQGQVVRIVARHTASTPAPTQPPQPAAAVRDAWARDLRSLGWPRREDITNEDVLEGMGWHDERTRVRIFWQDPDRGAPRLYTEWKGLP
jgi:hypothetical protein